MPQNGTVYIENAMETAHAQCITAQVVIGEFESNLPHILDLTNTMVNINNNVANQLNSVVLNLLD